MKRSFSQLFSRPALHVGRGLLQLHIGMVPVGCPYAFPFSPSYLRTSQRVLFSSILVSGSKHPSLRSTRSSLL
eukprot:4766963-Pyramimonas_sp.AAC.1